MRIKTTSALCVAAAYGILSATTVANTAGRILASYDTVKTMSCEVRRDTPLPNGEVVSMLSRVSFKRPNMFAVESISPEKRRMLCDGESVSMLKDGEKVWTREKFSELPRSNRAQLSCVPGTADELELFKEMEEIALEPSEIFSFRAGYAIDGTNGFIVLSLDFSNRLARLEIFADVSMSLSLIRNDYSAFKEVAPGAWIATLQKTERNIGNGGTVVTTTRIGNIKANAELPDEMFKVPAKAKVKSAKNSAVATKWDERVLISASYAAPAPENVRDGFKISSIFTYPARGVVWFYRKQISPAIGDKCRLHPSCSEYFMQASRKHGFLSIPMIADRLVREGVVTVAKQTPVYQPSGMILWADPVSDHDWWFAR